MAVGKELSWLRSLSLHVWYDCAPHETLASAFGKYKSALSAGESPDSLTEGHMACPYPQHMLNDGSLVTTNRLSDWRRQTDVQYELFELASGATW